MKKSILVVVLLSVVLIVAGFIYFKSVNKNKSDKMLPQNVDVKLPSGETITAYRTLEKTDKESKNIEGEGNVFVLQGTVLRESDGIMDSTIVLSDFGEKLVLFNAPYVNTISKELIGKKVKLKCKPFGRTSFKAYKGVWVEDILSVEQAPK